MVKSHKETSTYFGPLGILEGEALSITQRFAEFDHQPKKHAVLDRLSEHLFVLVKVEHLAIVEPLLRVHSQLEQIGHCNGGQYTRKGNTDTVKTDLI